VCTMTAGATQCVCPAGASVKTTTQPVTCQTCPAGTYKAGANWGQCQPCVYGTFSAAGSSQCTPWKTCKLGTRRIPGSATSDATCVTSNACLDDPCPPHTSSCTNLVALDSIGPNRVCGNCNAGYFKQAGFCVPESLIKPACYCNAESGWLLTPCDSFDSIPCPTTGGAITRACQPGGVWDALSVCPTGS
jgi:hypothetical protein